MKGLGRHYDVTSNYYQSDRNFEKIVEKHWTTENWYSEVFCESSEYGKNLQQFLENVEEKLQKCKSYQVTFGKKSKKYLKIFVQIRNQF